MNLIKKMYEEQQKELMNLLEWNSEEQRKYPRRPYFMDVDDATNDQVFRDFIQDLSDSGVFIQTRKHLCVGPEITMAHSMVLPTNTFKNIWMNLVAVLTDVFGNLNSRFVY